MRRHMKFSNFKDDKIMAKKELNDDILTGGSISSGKEKSKKSKGAKLPKVKIAKNTAKVIKSVVAVVVVLALLVTYVATGAVRKGFIHSTLQWTTGITAVTVTSDDGDKIKIPVSVYNYYYASTYNNLKSTQQQYEQYGLDPADMGIDVDFDKKLSAQKTTNDDDEVITWAQNLQDQVVESIKTTYTYYNEAVKANNGEEPEITEEQQAELDETMSQFKEQAEKYGYTLSGYLVKALGKGVTESVYRRESVRSYIAQNYSQTLSDEITATEYTDDQINAYKDEHIDELQSVDIRLFEASTEDIAKEFVGKLNADGSNFTELAAEYAAEGFDKSYYTEDGASTYLEATKAALQRGGFAIATAEHNHAEGEEHSDDEEQSYPGLDWLFSADRKAGESYQYSTSVVYILSPASLSDANLVNVRHILISPVDTTDSSTSAKDATDEQWADAYAKAQDVLNQYNSGEKTAESFAELAKANSADGSASNGGLYENVYPGQMVTPFNTWCFDNRSVGDTAIVKSEYGYHVMYFDGTADQKVWQYSAEQALTAEDSKTEAEKLQDAYSAKLNWFGSRYIEKDTDIDM